jgi:hypothetical protein
MKDRYNTPWTAAEDAVLLAHPSKSHAEVAKLLPGRTARACRHRRQTLAIKARSPVYSLNRSKSWEPEEDAVLLSNPFMTTTAVAELLPGRTPSACQCRRRLLGDRANRAVGRPASTVATPEEDAILRANFGRPLMTYQSQLPGRTRYWIEKRRAELGLRRTRDFREATEAIRVESLAKRLEPEGTAYRTASGQPARIINRFPMPDVPSVYGP